MNEAVVDTTDPFAVLGLPSDAGEAEVRARYLQLVREFPPERAPDRFRQIRAAYEEARDPLKIAARLVVPQDDPVSSWTEVLQEQKQRPPRLTPSFLLSLGNRTHRDDLREPDQPVVAPQKG